MKSATILASLLFGLASAWKRPCTPAEIALATGIHLNIQGQYSEYNGTLKIIEVETKQAGNETAFKLAQGMLQSDVQAGMNLRLFNQQIAPKGNPAIPGLAEYQAAEETEKDIADSLTGCYEDDKEMLDSLKTDILNGITLNEENLANVSCLVLSSMLWETFGTNDSGTSGDVSL